MNLCSWGRGEAHPTQHRAEHMEPPTSTSSSPLDEGVLDQRSAEPWGNFMGKTYNYMIAGSVSEYWRVPQRWRHGSKIGNTMVLCNQEQHWHFWIHWSKQMLGFGTRHKNSQWRLVAGGKTPTGAYHTIAQRPMQECSNWVEPGSSVWARSHIGQCAQGMTHQVWDVGVGSGLGDQAASFYELLQCIDHVFPQALSPHTNNTFAD